MNKSQEMSLVLMVIMPLCALIPGGVAVLLVYTEGIRFIPVFMFALAIVLGSFFWLIPAVMQKIRKPKKIQVDERDLLIHKNSVVTWIRCSPRSGIVRLPKAKLVSILPVCQNLKRSKKVTGLACH